VQTLIAHVAHAVQSDLRDACAASHQDEQVNLCSRQKATHTFLDQDWVVVDVVDLLRLAEVVEQVALVQQVHRRIAADLQASQQSIFQAQQQAKVSAYARWVVMIAVDGKHRKRDVEVGILKVHAFAAKQTQEIDTTVKGRQTRSHLSGKLTAWSLTISNWIGRSPKQVRRSVWTARKSVWREGRFSWKRSPPSSTKSTWMSNDTQEIGQTGRNARR
jgi:hypothetical protein